MDRKHITTHHGQSKWVDESNLTQSKFVQQQLDEQMSPSSHDLAKAYREHSEPLVKPPNNGNTPPQTRTKPLNSTLVRTKLLFRTR